MSYYLYQFGSQDLPRGDSTDGFGGSVASDASPTAGGVHFAYGSGLVPLGLHRVGHRGIYSSSVQTNVDAYFALLGQRLQLWRRRESDGAVQWKYARLLDAHWDRDVAQSQHAAIVSEFEAVGYWRSASGAVATRSSTGSLTPTGGGKARVFDAVVEFTASSTATQTIRFQDSTSGIDWTWSGAMTNTHVLRIDCGAFSVQNNGSDAYSGLTLNSGHASDYWCVILPGSNTFTFTLSAGSGTFGIAWYNQWV